MSFSQEIKKISLIVESLKKNRKNLRNSVYYFGGSLVQLFISIFTFPIYARHLSAFEFGIIGYMNSLTQFITPILILSLTNFYVMRYFHNTDEENRAHLFNIVFYLTIINIFTTLLIYLGIYFYFSSFDVKIEFFPYVLIIIVTLFFNVFKTFALTNYRIRKKAKSFFTLSVLSPVFNAAFSIFFVVQLHSGAAGRLGGPMLSSILIGSLSIFLLRRFAIVKPDFGFFKSAIRKIFPLIIASYAYIPINSIDRIFLERLGDIKELGLYSIGNQIAGFFLLASHALFQGFEPDVYNSVIQNNYRNLRSILFFYVGVLLAGFIFFYVIADSLISFLTSDRYNEASFYAKSIVFGNVFSALNLVVGAILLAQDKTKFASYIIYFGGFFSVIGYFIMIELYQFNGAIISKILLPVAMLILGVFLIFKTNKKLGEN